MKAPPPGLNISREAYDALDRLNFSKLKNIGISPAHYKHRIVADTDDTDALIRGTAAHLKIYEPAEYDKRVVIYREKRDDRVKAWRDFQRAHPGSVIITPNLEYQVHAIANAVSSSTMAQPYLGPGPVEQTILWRHETHAIGALEGFGFDCKARLDKILDWGCIVDLKTAKSAEPGAFSRQSSQLGYHVQAAWYADAYFAATGIRLPYAIIAVEATAPWVVQVYRVPDDLLEAGRDEYRGHLARLRACQLAEARGEPDAWPGYAVAPLDLELPPWLRPRDVEESE